MRAHRQQQVRARRRERMRGFIAQQFFERFDGGESRAILIDESSQRPAETFAAQGPREQREVNVAPGFVPGAEPAAGDIVAHAFRRTAEKRELPVVNDAGAIGCDVGEPSAFHHPVQQQLAAVFDEVRAVDQHDGRISLQRGPGFPGAVLNDSGNALRARRRVVCRLDQNFLHAALAVAFREGKDLQLLEIQGSGRVRHGESGVCPICQKSFRAMLRRRESPG